MICEMFAWYKTRGISLLEKLNELYRTFGYCKNTLHSYAFEGSAGFAKMQQVMASFRAGIPSFGGLPVEKTVDYSLGINGLPKSDVLKFLLSDGCSIVVRPSGTEPKLKTYISVTASDQTTADAIENRLSSDLEKYLS